MVAGPQTEDRSVAVVQSYDADTRELCLSGESVEGQDAAVEGVLCGEWRRTPGAARPEEGDEFRFVTIQRAEGEESAVYIHGAVLGGGS